VDDKKISQQEVIEEGARLVKTTVITKALGPRQRYKRTPEARPTCVINDVTPPWAIIPSAVKGICCYLLVA
jgi:hypothetical protein